MIILNYIQKYYLSIGSILINIYFYHKYKDYIKNTKNTVKVWKIIQFVGDYNNFFLLYCLLTNN
jgi:hypothetical protein